MKWDPFDRPGELGDDASPQEMLAAIVAQLRCSGRELVFTGVALGFVIIGVVMQAGAIGEVGDPLAPGRLALLAALLGAEARGITLLALAYRRLFDAVSGLRRVTAAPLVPGWVSEFGPLPAPSPAEMLRQVRVLVSAVHHRYDMAYRAMFWAVVGIGLFAAWTLANVISGAGR
jgi:hypothetical protein